MRYAALFILTVLAVSFLLHAADASAPARDRWEYKAVICVGAKPMSEEDKTHGRERGYLIRVVDVPAEINALGARGWELVSTNGLSTNMVLFFKRKK